MAAHSPALWIGKKGRVTDSGVRQMLERRCKDAGLDPIHPHMFRHTFAHLWLAAGGQENDLMRFAGWRWGEMVGRYAAGAADGRARDAHRRMALGMWCERLRPVRPRRQPDRGRPVDFWSNAADERMVRTA